MGFSKLGLNPKIMQALDEIGFAKPTPIQEQALPLLLQGEDLIGQAQTGTGKTAAFGICILEKLAQRQHSDKKTRSLILAPTRELAVQITAELQKIGRHLPLKMLAVYGGQDIERQLGPLHSGVDIVVGTPGRLLDHIERGTLKLDAVEVVVLDEADRMLDMGFIDDIEKILQKTPATRQTLLFSATMPSQILELSKRYLKSPQQVRVSEDSLSVKNIKQYYVETSKFDKLNVLLTLLVQKKPHLTLIFVRTKRGADRINEILIDRGFSSLALHGDMTQNRRDRSMESFRKKHINILVATDLASRGLDVSDVSHVINYDVTDDPYTYVHRIGRTGRMGKEGEAINLIFFDQTSLIPMLEKVTDSKMEQLQVEVKPELLPRRVRFTERPREERHNSHSHGSYRGHGSREGGRGSYGHRDSGGRSEGSHVSHGRGRDDRRGRDRRSHSDSGSRTRDSRGHQYFGRGR
ncbi:MAG: DEAD/DEAH box helicase [Candidatus Anstonellaceae archaeon]